MTGSQRYLLHLAVRVLAGFAGSVSLVTLWHLLRFASPPTYQSSIQAGYDFTQYFIDCIGWSFVVAYSVVGLILGWMVHGKLPAGLGMIGRLPIALAIEVLPVALGMVLPLPIAVAIEVFQDPTSHNLIPFEVVVYWFPAFIVALCSAGCGWLIRAKSTRGLGQPTHAADA